MSQGLGKHLSRLVPHFVFPSLCVSLLGVDPGPVHRQALPLGLRGSPHILPPRGPQLQAHQAGVSPSTKSQLQATLHKMPPHLQYQTCPPGQEPHAGPVREMLTSSSSDFEVFGRKEEGEFVMRGLRVSQNPTCEERRCSCHWLTTSMCPELRVGPPCPRGQ